MGISWTIRRPWPGNGGWTKKALIWVGDRFMILDIALEMAFKISSQMAFEIC
jgi:hypothetical protein